MTTARARRGGSTAWRRQSTPRQAISSADSAMSHIGWCGAWGPAVANATASNQGMHAGSSGGEGSGLALAMRCPRRRREQGQCFQASGTVRRASADGDAASRQVQSIRQSLGFGRQYPAGKHGKSPFAIGARRMAAALGPVEYQFSAAAAGKLFDQQRALR